MVETRRRVLSVFALLAVTTFNNRVVLSSTVTGGGRGPLPPATGVPVYTGAPGQTLIMQDSFDAYTSVASMGAKPPQYANPYTAPQDPSPISDGNPVDTAVNQLITGRSGSGKAIRMLFTGADQFAATFTTENATPSADGAPNFFTYYARVTPSGSLVGQEVNVKWFEAWRLHSNTRAQMNTRFATGNAPDPAVPLPPGINMAHEYIDQFETNRCAQQPVGPYPLNLWDGNWHLYTYAFKAHQSSGNKNGYAKMWVDTTLIVDVEQATVGVTPPSGTKEWCLQSDVDQNIAVADAVGFCHWGSVQTGTSIPWTLDVDDFTWWHE